MLSMAPEALHLAEKVDRDRVGVSFNLCHALKAGQGGRIPDLLRKPAPKLFFVQINGARKTDRA